MLAPAGRHGVTGASPIARIIMQVFTIFIFDRVTDKYTLVATVLAESVERAKAKFIMDTDWSPDHPKQFLFVQHPGGK